MDNPLDIISDFIDQAYKANWLFYFLGGLVILTIVYIWRF